MSKIALITGASRGIGREIALTLGAEGHTIIVNYSGSKDKAEAVVQEIINNGGKAESYQCHVQNADDVKAMIKYITDTYGSIDIVVNNAGITRDNLLMRMKESEFDDVIDVNLKGVFNVIKSVSRPMIRQKSGSIVNISSIVGSLGNAGQTNYVATKAGIDGITKSVARELASKNITVNGVAPGFIKSDMTDVLGDDVKDGMLQQIPLKHFGEAKDIANTVNFLTSDKASYITGQVIHVNGGMYMG
ncbi:3-oxoacyl-[acyl-carrier-protein] reductase FabG [Jeotgalicoccus aerolatus]|uniref:3-oxoacyl-[acyl-carrier-protein] reductase n=1 Tax=Jeotgalicoccus aerolatus TaxID=709510 RepID=A0ABS4HKL9_9STAP|nr:3-oxoacyl-[acyl-carrier-protein] reductase [Jeotgalicoccus aerolatus]MBP1951455.1 3-oxoacyl-[acyl-carrier protein] reductase [Jeotgalicoccus aerolatus]GGD97380.1 3-oxoacyl-[acyl-carrier-protein] reductase FabG [Jeotgalicoccus aerolatus]CAD2076557.1 3-oxoacyl-[acyl-carrier-protein] reductase FabG [Jeotgalicoccus aerolatus]